MKPFWIDAHCHLSDPRMDSFREACLERASASGIQGFILGGVDPADWQRQEVLFQNKKIQFIKTFGLHPWAVSTLKTDSEIEEQVLKLEEALPGAQGLGELGLDRQKRFLDKKTQEFQEKAFRLQLGIANRLGIPIVLHIVRAHSEAYLILKEFGPFQNGGMVHSFSGDWQAARRYLDLGLSISFSGTICDPKNQKLRECLPKIPKDRLLFETDSPDQRPVQPFYTENDFNEPLNLIGIAKAAGLILGWPWEECLDVSSQNCKRIFKEFNI